MYISYAGMMQFMTQISIEQSICVKHSCDIARFHQPFWMTSWWRHQMETFSASLAICVGNSPVPGEFPTQRPVTRSFDVFFDLRWVNNREAGD